MTKAKPKDSKPKPPKPPRVIGILKYKPEYPGIVRKLYADGATDNIVGKKLGVDRRTVIRWREGYPEFKEACDDGKIEDIQECLHQIRVSKYTGDYKIVKVPRQLPDGSEIWEGKIVQPNPRLMELYLRNRARGIEGAYTAGNERDIINDDNAVIPVAVNLISEQPETAGNEDASEPMAVEAVDSGGG